MDTDERPTGQVEQPAIDAGDWRAVLQPDTRQRIVNKIVETLKKHLPYSGLEGLEQLRKIAVRFEDKIYVIAKSQSDYLRKISLKMLSMEAKYQRPMYNSLPPRQLGPEDAKKAELEELTREIMELILEPEELYKDVEVVVCTSSSNMEFR
ncbi:mediator of RNA polymerase II transcription subunit 15a isoform X2 [Jatropha curcas]|uniref:mediator of RNA polymerase II transcription subunit 15a isoform X2 n=1 Tax=Jatropha curcas TaxID=180498 RepID=UPI0018930111|nr:mediator of RNA polymerase II transcription subunit 15a isoform X2 [Jatropha curcas]XP_037491898.1 mediator of RNA polymerase II transcription subunit 15a isoform X2 [Jatropha curcas]